MLPIHAEYPSLVSTQASPVLLISTQNCGLRSCCGVRSGGGFVALAMWQMPPFWHVILLGWFFFFCRLQGEAKNQMCNIKKTGNNCCAMGHGLLCQHRHHPTHTWMPLLPGLLYCHPTYWYEVPKQHKCGRMKTTHMDIPNAFKYPGSCSQAGCLSTCSSHHFSLSACPWPQAASFSWADPSWANEPDCPMTQGLWIVLV